jgi:ppGpp synthetase/RelA/SpoT-type nucleotidyltranferase
VLVDRRLKPSHGYRAVHLIVKHLGKVIEVQLRTELQHNWAQLSEKLADKIDPTIKYGGGDRIIQNELSESSDFIKQLETAEGAVAEGDPFHQIINATKRRLGVLMDKAFKRFASSHTNQNNKV